MNHSKVLLVDELWVVVGSSDFDKRSFGLNGELSLALPDRALAARLSENFERDAALGRSVDQRDWRRRPMSERLLALLGALVERQQQGNTAVPRLAAGERPTRNGARSRLRRHC